MFSCTCVHTHVRTYVQYLHYVHACMHPCMHAQLHTVFAVAKQTYGYGEVCNLTLDIVN